MPPAPKITTRLLKLSAACASLGCCKRTFSRRWHSVFTDPRPPEKRTKRFERKVYEDELAVAVNEANKGTAAVLLFRKVMGRL